MHQEVKLKGVRGLQDDDTSNRADRATKRAVLRRHPGPKELRWCNAKHGLNEQATTDRTDPTA